MAAWTFKVGQRYDVAIVLESTNTMGLTNIGYSCPALGGAGRRGDL
ncbi:MAG TPA: hypothetical protein VER96_01640 [Polyangiaceae bacterium]|nr:hypothetical protein [Polyangiaceae bacterium]